MSRSIVRELAARVAEMAASDENACRRRLWREVNSLRKPERPPVICHPGCWEELLSRATVVSEDSFEAGIEYRLRQIRCKQQIGDDTIAHPDWPVPVTMRLEGGYLWGVPIGYIRPDTPHGARCVGVRPAHQERGGPGEDRAAGLPLRR